MAAPRLTKHRLDPERARELLKALMPVPDEGVPEVVYGWRDAAGKVRRIAAQYASGWRIKAGFNAAGDVTWRSGSLRLTTTVGAS